MLWKNFVTHLFSVALTATFSAEGAITSISVPQESQDFGNNDSYPARDNLWSASVPPFPFDSSRGIAHLIDTSASALATDTSPQGLLAVLHSHRYTEPFVPVFSTVISYTFDEPTVVDSLNLLQHTNGITRLEGFVGNDLGSLTSVGNIFGPRGDVRGASVFSEGESSVFDFNNTLAGTIFQFRITQTSLTDGYALHRAYPLRSDGTQISAAVPEPSGSALLVVGALGVAASRKRHNAAATS